MTAFSTILRHPTLRLTAVIITLFGVHNASVYPYQSLIAIERIGLSEAAFALLLILASTASVAASVLFGVLSDRYGHRRRIAMVTALCSTIGIAMILLNPGPLTFWIGQGILLPISWSIYGQMFTLIRLARPDEGPDRDAVLSAIRSLMSVGFTVMLLAWIFAFARGVGEMAVYVTGGVASLVVSLAVIFFWPPDGPLTTRGTDSLARNFRDIAHGGILIRLGLIGALAVPGSVFFVLVSLVFDASPVRTSADVALYIGMVAGWEVPFMLLLPRFIAHMKRGTVMALASLFYALHLALMPFVSDTPLIWALPLLAGASGAMILTLPISYYQDLVAGRPGTAAALLALQKLVVDVLTALIFALGTALGGFGTVALIGVAVALSGALGLYLADRNRWLLAPA